MSRDKDDWNSHWQKFGNSSEINPAVLYRQNYLLKILSGHSTEPGNLLLDIGCGTGAFLRRLMDSKLDLTLIGIEPSESGCERAIAQTNVRIVRGDIFTLSPVESNLDHVADFAICSEVIEHLDDPTQFLQKCKEFIKPSGKIIITVPGGWRSKYDKHIGHRQHYSKNLLLETLSKAGYTNIQIFRAGFPIFNLYKLMTILAGKRLIQSASSTEGVAESKLIRIISKVFNSLFRYSFSNSLFGWQLIALAEIKD